MASADLTFDDTFCPEVDARWEPVIERLKRDGRSKIEVIRVLVDSHGMSLRRAKELVHFSAVWAETREADEAFHAEMVRSVRGLSRRAS